MPRPRRDRDAEKTAITAAADRLLAGTPLRSVTGKLTVTELIAESGLRRDVVYEHDKTDQVVQDFLARAKAQQTVPAAMRQLTDDRERLARELAETKTALAAECAKVKTLMKVAAELSLELEQARDELAAAAKVTRLPTRQQ
jgi:hypothetical protein